MNQVFGMPIKYHFSYIDTCEASQQPRKRTNDDHNAPSPNPTPSLTKETIEETAFNAGMYTCPKVQVKKDVAKTICAPSQ